MTDPLNYSWDAIEEHAARAVAYAASLQDMAAMRDFHGTMHALNQLIYEVRMAGTAGKIIAAEIERRDGAKAVAA